jgi:hypothetical protein
VTMGCMCCFGGLQHPLQGLMLMLGESERRPLVEVGRRKTLLGHQNWLGIPGKWGSNSPHGMTLPEWLRYACGVVVLRVPRSELGIDGHLGRLIRLRCGTSWIPRGERRIANGWGMSREVSG